MSELFPSSKGLSLGSIRRFKPEEYITNPDGTISSELTRTVQTPQGSWANVPTLYASPDGYVQLPDSTDDVLGRIAEMLEQRGLVFDKYNTLEEAEKSARGRSLMGGAAVGRR